MREIFWEGTTEGLVTNWFEKNFNLLGFIKIVKNVNITPDYFAYTDEINFKKVECEFFSSSFIKHRHKIKDVDIVLCAFADVPLPVDIICLENFGIITEYSKKYRKLMWKKMEKYYRKIMGD